MQGTATPSIPLEPLEKTGQELTHTDFSSVKRSQPVSQEPPCSHAFTDKDPEHREEMLSDDVSTELGLTVCLVGTGLPAVPVTLSSFPFLRQVSCQAAFKLTM